MPTLNGSNTNFTKCLMSSRSVILNPLRIEKSDDPDFKKLSIVEYKKELGIEEERYER